MSTITYWQGPVPLMGEAGVCGDAALLPQDEVTAAVVVAVLAERDFRAAPNWYRARVRGVDGRVVLVGEDDALVVFALRLVRRAMHECVSQFEALGQVRAAVLAAGLPGGVAGAAGSAGDPGPVEAVVPAVAPGVSGPVEGRVS